MAAGGNDDTGALRRQLLKESAKIPNGAAFRWAVGAAPNGFLELQLQSLPMPAAVINSKPMLRNVSIFIKLRLTLTQRVKIKKGISKDHLFNIL